MYNEEATIDRARDRGKAPSRPLAIGAKSSNPSCFDAFSFNNAPGPSRPRQTSPSSPTSSYGVDIFSFSPTSELMPGSLGTDMTSPGSSPASAGNAVSVGKGKARDTPPPSLPPLSFSPTSLVDGDGETRWPVQMGSPASLSPAHSPGSSSSPPGTGSGGHGSCLSGRPGCSTLASSSP